MAATRIDEAGLQELERCLQLMTDGLERGLRVVEHDSAFHEAIARGTGNDMLVRLIGALSDTLQPSRERSFEPRDAGQSAVADHRRILDALRRHEPDDARRAMRDHLDRVEKLLRSTLNDAGAASGED